MHYKLGIKNRESGIRNHESGVGSIVRSIIIVFIILNSLFLIPQFARADDPTEPPETDACSQPTQSASQRLQCRAERLFGQSVSTTAQAGPAPLALRIGGLIRTALSLVGIVFLAFTVYSGIQWMMAGGNEEVITKTKARIAHAAIGLAIVVGSWVITNFILKAAFRGEPQRAPGAFTIPGTGGNVGGSLR